MCVHVLLQGHVFPRVHELRSLICVYIAVALGSPILALPSGCLKASQHYNVMCVGTLHQYSPSKVPELESCSLEASRNIPLGCIREFSVSK